MLKRKQSRLSGMGSFLLFLGLLGQMGCDSTTTAPPGDVTGVAQSDGVNGDTAVPGDVVWVDDVVDAPVDVHSGQDVISVADIAEDMVVPVDVLAFDVADAILPDTGVGSDVAQVTDAFSDAEVGDTVAGSDQSGTPDVASSGPFKILFVGNSYTSANNLASLVAQSLEGEGLEIETQAITKGGAWLQDHLETATTVDTIATGGWTHVVLQEQSYLPVVAPEIFQTAATGLATLIHVAGAIPVFFETWARKEGNSLYEGDLDGFTPLMMQAALRGAYTQAADANDGVFAPVGDAWEVSLEQHPEIGLHSGDGSHPGIQGSYLAACVFYGVITGTSPVGLSWWPGAVEEESAIALQAMANSVLP